MTIWRKRTIKLINHVMSTHTMDHWRWETIDSRCSCTPYTHILLNPCTNHHTGHCWLWNIYCTVAKYWPTILHCQRFQHEKKIMTILHFDFNNMLQLSFVLSRKHSVLENSIWLCALEKRPAQCSVVYNSHVTVCGIMQNCPLPPQKPVVHACVNINMKQGTSFKEPVVNSLIMNEI